MRAKAAQDHKNSGLLRHTYLVRVCSRGFGLIEVMVASAVLAIVALAITDLVQNAFKGSAGAARKTAISNTILQINALLASQGACRQSLFYGAAPTDKAKFWPNASEPPACVMNNGYSPLRTSPISNGNCGLIDRIKSPAGVIIAQVGKPIAPGVTVEWMDLQIESSPTDNWNGHCDTTGAPANYKPYGTTYGGISGPFGTGQIRLEISFATDTTFRTFGSATPTTYSWILNSIMDAAAGGVAPCTESGPQGARAEVVECVGNPAGIQDPAAACAELGGTWGTTAATQRCYMPIQFFDGDPTPLGLISPGVMWMVGPTGGAPAPTGGYP